MWTTIEQCPEWEQTMLAIMGLNSGSAYLWAKRLVRVARTFEQA